MTAIDPEFTTHIHTTRLAALDRLNLFLAASTDVPDDLLATFAEHGAAVSFGTLRQVAALADARADAC